MVCTLVSKTLTRSNLSGASHIEGARRPIQFIIIIAKVYSTLEQQFLSKTAKGKGKVMRVNFMINATRGKDINQTLCGPCSRLERVAKKILRASGAALVMLALSACGGSNGDSTPSPTPSPPPSPTPSMNTGSLDTPRDIYKANDIIDIDIEMSDAAWTELRFDGPQISDWSTACEFEGFDYHNATVTIDGEEVEDVAIRAKGWIGSINPERPSLKLNFGRGDAFDGRTFHGEKRITLNNNNQDSSNIRQCLSYSIFNAAGIHAPRCNFARVTAQGQDLGVYTHVEAIKKPFLERTFGDDSGNLFEAQRDGEFNDSHLPYFQLKTNEDINDRSLLASITSVLNSASNDILWDELDAFIDMDQFLTYSVVEALVGHTDGYNGFQNNVYLYQDPADNRLHFIPWGTDQTFITRYIYHPDPVLQNTPVPPSVMIGSELMTRLWDVSDFQQRYDARMREVLDTSWDEDALIAEADRMQLLLNADTSEVQKVRDFINARRANIEAELETTREWAWSLMDDVEACPVPTQISGQFDIEWNNNTDPNAEYSITVDGDEYPVQYFAETGSGGPSNYMVLVAGPNDPEASTIRVVFYMPQVYWQTGTVPFLSVVIAGFVTQMNPDGSEEFLGQLTDGSIVFESADNQQGGRVTGTFDAAFVLND